MLTTQLTGFKELGAKLQELAADVAEKELRAATLAATSVVRKRVRDNAFANFVMRTGTLDRAIFNKWVKSDSAGRWAQTYVIGVRQGRRFALKKGGKAQRGTGKDAYYWWWLEFGTAKTHARPFVRPALPAEQSRAIEAMRKRLAKGVEARARAARLTYVSGG